jgi:hypothetical protein
MPKTPSKKAASGTPAVPTRPSDRCRDATALIRRVCGLAGSMTFLADIQAEVRNAGIDTAVAQRDTAAIFDWLLTTFSYQGVSDQVARKYIQQNGSASWSGINAQLAKSPTCPRLRNYRTYSDCRYDKTSFSCSEPEHIDACPVPLHRLRNGRLNQTAYSFFLFVRDIARGDIVGWIDNQVENSAEPEIDVPDSEPLVGPLRHVFGVSDKVLTMALSSLLLGVPDGRPLWFETGTAMIAIDTLVHNFLHRTGILSTCGTPHGYGVGCYATGGCAETIRKVSARIDARDFNPDFPKVFPRFVQHAVWRYCAADGLNICNGNRIDDRKPCQISYCHFFAICDRKALKT